jgi:LysR family hydrogen peroxide-inducible transcriptional activator
MERGQLAPDMLVLADPHCLRDQTLAACGGHDARARALRAASLETLVNMVAADYGTMVIPMLAAHVSAVRDVVSDRSPAGSAVPFASSAARASSAAPSSMRWRK